MQKSASKWARRPHIRARRGFTLLEVALAVVSGSILLASVAYTTNQVRVAANNVFDETFLQTVTRDTQLNLDTALDMLNKDGTPETIKPRVGEMTFGQGGVRFGKDPNAYDAGGKFEFTTDGGNSWRSLADMGDRGMFQEAEFAYGKYATREDDDIPTPDRMSYTLDDRVRNNLLRLTTVLQKNDMVPLYLQSVRSPRALAWSYQPIPDKSIDTNGDGTPDAAGDLDGDGVTDDVDSAPLNPETAFHERYPAGTAETASIAFEDLYPSVGDADYNDLVSAFFIREKWGPGKRDAVDVNQRPGLRQVYMRFFAQARGAGYNHTFKMNVAQLVKGNGKVVVYRYDDRGVLRQSESFKVGDRPYIEIFPDTNTALPGMANSTPGQSIQQSWTTVVRIDLDNPNQNRYGTTQAAPYDPYLTVKNTGHDIHLPLFDADGNGSPESYKNPTTGVVKAMVDSQNNAWALLVPTNWAWPLEGQEIYAAFPKYTAWRDGGRPVVSDWYLFPRVNDRYKTASLNTGGVAAPVAEWKNINDNDENGNARYVYVFDPRLFVGGANAFVAPVVNPHAEALAVASVAPSPTPSGAGTGDLHPIALHDSVLVGKNPGESLGDIYCGGGAGNFGWMAWDQVGNAPRLATSLSMPGDSHTYKNPNDLSDRIIDVGDYISGNSGISNSSDVRQKLDALKAFDIVVPTWDTATGTGANLKYHCTGFAKVRITDYRLPNQNRITATFLGRTDAMGNFALPSPTPSPSVAPSAAPSAASSAAASTSPSATPTPSAQMMPFAVHAALFQGDPVNSSYNGVKIGTSSSRIAYLTWEGASSESKFRSSLALPGNSQGYVNPNDASDQVLEMGDRVAFFTEVANNSSNRNALNGMANQEVVVPLFTNSSGGQVDVSGFAKVKITSADFSKNPDRISIKFLGYCDRFGN